MRKSLFVSCILLSLSLLSLSSCMTSSPLLGAGTASAPTAQTPQSGNQSGVVGDVLGSLLGGLIGNAVPVNENNIVGTWIYQSPEVRFESENFLSQAGGEVAAASIEKKLAEMYSKLGVVPGSSGFIFNADKTCTVALGTKAINGTYTVDSKNNTIHIVSSTGLIKLTGKVYFGLNSLVVLFESNKILTIAQTLAAFTGSTNSSLGALSGALSQYKGLMLGMNLAKQ